MQPRDIVAAPGADSQEAFWTWVDRACRETARELIQWTLAQLQHQAVGAGWHERTAARVGYRNGVYRRTLTSPYGPLRIVVPRLRGVPLDCRLVFDRYRRRCRDVDRVLQRVVLMGVSLRDAAEVGEQLWGETLSPQTVGALLRWLDHALAAWRRRPLDAVYRVVQIDGMYVTVEGQKQVVMLVLGLREDGRKEVLGFSLETGEGCRELLWDLRRRGLEGVQVFVTDDSGAVRSALEEVYPEVPHQVCCWHRLVGLWERLGPVPWRHAMVREAGRIFRCVSLAAALEETDRWTRRWAGRAEAAVAWWLDGLADSLGFYHLPEPWWRRTRTTSLTERLIRKLRRRLRPMGAFANTPAAERAVFGQLLRWHLLPEITHNA
jgi:transposase-like protein